jgi:hypothetical protein
MTKRWAGEVARTRARTTGATVVLLDLRNGGEWAGTEDEGGRWLVICDTHSRVLQAEKRADAIYAMRHPELWCGACNGTDDELLSEGR